MTEWSSIWPTEPGMYLFYGNFLNVSGTKPRIMICKATVSANGHLMFYSGVTFLFPTEWKGVFKPFEIPPEAIQAYNEMID